MLTNFGVFRRGEQMSAQLETIAGLRERYDRVVVDDKGEVFNNDLTQTLELGFCLELAACMLTAGVLRKESRGGHARPDDFPERDDAEFLAHSLIRLVDGRPVRLEWRPVTITEVATGRRGRTDAGRPEDLALEPATGERRCASTRSTCPSGRRSSTCST